QRPVLGLTGTCRRAAGPPEDGHGLVRFHPGVPYRPQLGREEEPRGLSRRTVAVGRLFLSPVLRRHQVMEAVETRLAALPRTVDELSAREAIRDVLYRYARGVDRADVDVLKSCYHPEAVDAHWTFIGNAHEFAEEILESHQMGQLPLLKHFITNIFIELDGDRAFVESSFLCMVDLPVQEGGPPHLLIHAPH